MPLLSAPDPAATPRRVIPTESALARSLRPDCLCGADDEESVLLGRHARGRRGDAI